MHKSKIKLLCMQCGKVEDGTTELIEVEKDGLKYYVMICDKCKEFHGLVK